jgi:mannosyltransferase OCH1-like enzyme
MVLPSSPRARRAIRILVILFVVSIFFNLVLRLYNFANLFRFFEEQPGTLVFQRELLDAYNARQAQNDTSAVPVIPKILHQVYHNWTDPENTVITLPDDWAAARQSCIDLNPGWEFKLWTIENSRNFIEDEFPWFTATYDNYKFPVQRVDVIRYFALRHYGGIYIDLDNVSPRLTDGEYHLHFCYLLQRSFRSLES